MAAPGFLTQNYSAKHKQRESHQSKQIVAQTFLEIAILFSCDGCDLALSSKIGLLSPSRWTRGYFIGEFKASTNNSPLLRRCSVGKMTIGNLCTHSKWVVSAMRFDECGGTNAPYKASKTYFKQILEGTLCRKGQSEGHCINLKERTHCLCKTLYPKHGWRTSSTCLRYLHKTGHFWPKQWRIY